TGQLLGRLGELITVTQGYEQAITAILRENAEALEAANLDEALELIEVLHGQQASQIFLHAGVPSDTVITSAVPNAISAREVVDADSQLANLLDQLLAGHYIIEEMSNAQAVLAQK